MSYEEIARQLEACLKELRDDRRKVHAGLKNPNFFAIRKSYGSLFSKETIDRLRELLGTTTGRDARERMERVMFELVEGIVELGAVESVEAVMKEKRRAVACVEGEKIPFLELHRMMSREKNSAKRERLREAYVEAVKHTEEKRLEAKRARRKRLASFGFGSFREYAETKKRIDYEALLKRSVAILEETTGLYRRVLTEILKERFGKGLGELNIVHAMRLFSGCLFDTYFPRERLLHYSNAAIERMGLDIDHPSVTIDAEDRPGKHPRPLTIAIDVPHDVHLILQPHGGYADYVSLLHESGHALHRIHADATLPFEWRMLSRDSALTETFAYTFEQLFLSPLWLEHGLRLPKHAAEDVVAWTLLRNLYLLRRHIAKCTYELSFDANPHDVHTARRTYAKTLGELTGFIHEEDTYLIDMDPVFRSADRLRAWMISAQLEEHLVRTYGDRWFLKRETGLFFRQAFSGGDSQSAEEFISSLGMTPWDPLPLIRKFDGVKKLLS